jgi:hypothetical protein
MRTPVNTVFYRTLPTCSLEIGLIVENTLRNGFIRCVKARFVSETAGPCSSNPSDYDSFCPSLSCVCDIYSGTVNGALLGKGTIDISLTVDTGAATPSSGSSCRPFFGVASFAARRDSETEDTTGTICSPFGNNQKSSVAGDLAS